MRKYLKEEAWSIVEEGFDPELQEASESIFSIGNGKMGQRANFEEAYSGPSLQGSYIAGVYYPDKTRVGWWKNGYPKYFAKVINSINWIGIDVAVNGIALDLATCEVRDFTRILDMRRSILSRRCDVALADGSVIRIESERFLSYTEDELGLIRYSMTPLSGDAEIVITRTLMAPSPTAIPTTARRFGRR
jgi:maltose phosphorylase